MFTGIVEALGRIEGVQERGGDRRYRVATPTGFMQDVRPGDSIACSGVCLTVLEPDERGFSADASRETLGATTAGRWGQERVLNLEKALTLAKPLGGHLVAGHVDGVGKLLDRREEARSWRLRLAPPPELARYIARKGSITVDGVSLTVNDVDPEGFGVNIVPHTFQHTTLGQLQPGEPVNLEVDLIARYLERLLGARNEP